MDVFDHHSEEYSRNWREIYAKARASGCPVIHADLYEGFDVLLRHADVQEAFRDYKTFASERILDDDEIPMEGGVGIPEHPFRVGFLEMDPPESLSLRRWVNPWLNPRTVEAGRGRIEEAADWAFDRVIAGGECDLISDLASPFQCMVLMDLLGLPLDRWMSYKAIVDKIVGQEQGSLEGIQWILGDLFDEVERQKAEGGDGLIAALAVAEVDGEPIEDDLTTELTLMLMLGGMDTTIATIGHVMLHLQEHPEDRRRLLEQPDLVPGFIEEVLRFYVPAPAMARTVRHPVTFAGQEYQRGDRVLCAIASANLDEEAFVDADTFDMTRSPNPHMTFGTGTHRCIGADLARTNAEFFLRRVLARMPEFEIDLDAVRRHDSIPLANGFTAMPLRFPPGEAQSAAGDSQPAYQAPRITPAPLG